MSTDYGRPHRARRARLAPMVEAGIVACARCGKMIAPGEKWELDHAPGKQGYLGASHFKCNRSHGGKLGAAITNRGRRYAAQPPTPRLFWSRVWFEPVPDDAVVLGSKPKL